MTSNSEHPERGAGGPARGGGRPRAAFGVALILALAGAIVMLQVLRERRLPAPGPAEQTLYISSPAVITRAALGFDDLVADLYWIRAIQYYGRARLLRSTAARYDLLYPLLDVTTSLDPRFRVAYNFGAFFLSERAPGGAGRPDLAVQLLEKGMAANPERWEYPHDIGFVYYRQGDYVKAAEWFRRAAAVPGATNWLAPLAATTLATGGDLRSSRLLWQNVLATSEHRWLRDQAVTQLRKLDAADQVQQLQRLTVEYERRHGVPPPTWQHLIDDGALRALPRDPAGHVYALNPWWGIVDVAEDSPLYPLPVGNPR